MKADKDFILSEMGDEYVLTCTDAKKFSGMIRLNQSGAFLFRQLSDEITFDELLDRACGEYDAERSVIEKDMMEFLSDLRAAGVINE